MSVSEPRASTSVVIALLGLLLGLQPVTTDLFLPALPSIASDLASPMARTQLTLSALILSFGVSQLLMGPLSDRFGRRPVLVGGLTLYVIACAGSVIAPSVGWLVVCRAIQGVGMAASVVCARAVVRDLFDPVDGARMMSKALTLLGLIALASPMVGALSASSLGWRGALAVTGVFAGVTLTLLVTQLRETVRAGDPDAMNPQALWATWFRISKHRGFQAWTALVTCTYGALYTYLAGSSFVFIDVLGSSRWAYGLYLSTSSLAYVVGTVWCRRWLLRWGLLGTIRRGAAFSFGGGCTMAGLALAGVHQPWALALPQALFAFGHGIHQPCGQASIVGPFPDHAGAAAALSGFVMSLAAFGIGGWLGVSMNGTVYPLALTQGALSLLTALVALTFVQRHGQVPTQARA